MEADAGAGGLSTFTATDPSAAAGSLAEPADEPSWAATEVAPGTGASRFGRRLPIAISAVLILLAGCTTAGGYLALQAHRKAAALSSGNDAALAAAKGCVAATQPPNAAALAASQHTLSVCSTGNFGSQAVWYGEVLAQAYEAVDVRVEVPEMHAAVERNNDDGSVVALVVFRAKISQTGVADRMNSYRIRVTMIPENGQFKVAELDQVAK